MEKGFTYNPQKLSKLIADVGFTSSSLSGATYEFIDGGVDRKTIDRMKKKEVNPRPENFHAVMQAIAKKRGHNDVEEIKKEIEFEVITEVDPLKPFIDSQNHIKKISGDLKKTKVNDFIILFTVISLFIIQVITVVLDVASSSVITGIIVPIYLIILALVLPKENKYKKSLLITATVLCFGLIYFNIAGQFHKSISIQNVKVVESECLWQNEIKEEKGEKKVIGFSEKTMDVWTRWRTYPKLKGKDPNYDNSPTDKNLRIVYSILKKKLKNIDYASSEKQYVMNECINNYSIIADSTYKTFFKNIIESYRGYNNFIECIKSIWPSKDELDFLNRTDTTTWKALVFFQNDLFRDRYPIFAIEIKNESDKPIELEKLSVEMKDLQVDMYPKEFAGGYPIKEIANYELTLTNLNNPKYIKFLEDSIKAHPHGYKAIYKGELNVSYLDLNPRLIVNKEGTVLIYVRIKGGYRWPCKIKFSFYDSDNEKKDSNWFNLKVISDPSINLYKYGK